MDEMTSDIVNKIERYFVDRPEAVAVYLFGSYARGREKRFSDVDLGVLLEQQMLSKQNDLEMTYLVDLGRVLREDCHIVIMNRVGEGVLAQIFKDLPGFQWVAGRGRLALRKEGSHEGYRSLPACVGASRTVVCL
jgi:predicted nucleotidyltransferase